MDKQQQTGRESSESATDEERPLTKREQKERRKQLRKELKAEAKRGKKASRKRRRRSSWPLILLFLVGFLILAYPYYSQYYYRIDSGQTIDMFEQEKEVLSEDELNQRKVLAVGYNEALIGAHTEIEDPYEKEEAKEREEAGVANYARMLEVAEQIGNISIPKLNMRAPIYAGTSEDILQKGVGHMEGTSLPIGGKSTHAVLTAHRGLPDKELFTHLDEMVEGDKFYVTNIFETLAYQVYKIETIEPSDFSSLQIDMGEDEMTLLTCTPYMINTHRLLIHGRRIPYAEESYNREVAVGKQKSYYKTAFIITVGILAFMVLILFLKSWEGRRMRQVIAKLRLELKTVQAQLDDMPEGQTQFEHDLKELRDKIDKMISRSED